MMHVIALLGLMAACSPAVRTPPTRIIPEPTVIPGPQTRAERTNYTETSHFADVVAFLDSLQRLNASMHVAIIGSSPEGREIPMVIASRPLVTTPEQARRLGRPVVYVQANIHAGEIEGKEAMQALLRDLLLLQRPNVLDSIVLLVVPIYNADGNERFDHQAKNREEQNGPEIVGQRANGQGLDLNRDYVKTEAPETQASIGVLNTWDPDVFVDLHTTDGSFHGYALTYAPSLSPTALGTAAWTHDTLLPELRARMYARNIATYDYGNFSQDYGTDVNTDTTKQAWYTYDARPRFGTNYVGIRGRVSILSEAFSHDPLERRVAAMYAFVLEILSASARHGDHILALSALADRGPRARATAAHTDSISIRAMMVPTARMDTVVQEDLASTHDSTLTQPGVPRGLRRTGHFRRLHLPVYDHFVSALNVSIPAAYAIVARDSTDELPLLATALELQQHGIMLEVVEDTVTAQGERFNVDSSSHAPKEFQQHHETTVFGNWSAPTSLRLPRGTYLVITDQPLGTLAMYLLEPRSDDGLAQWNWFDRWLAGKRIPVVRLDALPLVPRRLVPPLGPLLSGD